MRHPFRFSTSSLLPLKYAPLPLPLHCPSVIAFTSFICSCIGAFSLFPFSLLAPYCCLDCCRRHPSNKRPHNKLTRPLDRSPWLLRPLPSPFPSRPRRR